MQAPAQKPLILIGGSARAAALSAVRGGFEVCAFDRFGDVDLRNLCRRWLPLPDPCLLPSQIAQLPLAPVVPLGGCERFAAWIERAAERGSLCGANAEQFRRSQSPTMLRRIAKESGLRFPRTYVASRGGGRPLAAEEGHWLVKRQQRSGGLDVHGWDGSWPPPGGHDLQQRIEGRSLGACYLATSRAAVLLGVFAALRQRTGPAAFTYAGSLGPLPLDAEQTRQLQRLGQVVAERLELKGLFNVDLIRTPAAQMYLLEINPRYSASMELLEDTLVPPRTRSDPPLPAATLMAAHVAAIHDQPVRLPQVPGVVRCKRILYAPHDLRFAAWQGPSSDQPAGIVCDIPAEGSLIRRGQPICSCLTEATTLRGAWRRVAGVADRVLRQGAIARA